MNEDELSANGEALAKAQATIARQAKEIERLRSRIAADRYAEEFREALTLASTAGTIASPVTHTRLLEMIVEAAAYVLSARAASLLLINQQTQELIFEVALGQKAREVKKFAVPMGHGIAGLVAVSGQPMAVSDAQSDPRQASDIAKSVGYIPQSILCVPLFYNDQIIGVLEVFDKADGSSFTTGDMEVLGMFANQAAVAIEQSRTHHNLAALVSEVLGSLDGLPKEQKKRLQEGAQVFATYIEEDEAYRQALDLAQLVREIVWRGEDEMKACRTILRGFADYLRSKPKLAGNLE